MDSYRPVARSGRRGDIRTDHCPPCRCWLACSPSLAALAPSRSQAQTRDQTYKIDSSISPLILAWSLMSTSRSISNLIAGAPPRSLRCWGTMAWSGSRMIWTSCARGRWASCPRRPRLRVLARLVFCCSGICFSSVWVPISATESLARLGSIPGRLAKCSSIVVIVRWRASFAAAQDSVVWFGRGCGEGLEPAI
jgi:hypothetical protein